jgi:hypothetical protein
VAGTLAAAIISGGASWLITDKQHDDERTRASIAFLREQREERYLEFLDSSSKYDLAVALFTRKYSRNIGQEPPAPTATTVHTDVDALREKEAELMQNLSEVRVVGSAPAVEAANKMAESFQDLDWLEGWALERVSQPQQFTPKVPVPLPDTGSEARLNYREELERRAREDAALRAVGPEEKEVGPPAKITPKGDNAPTGPR